MYSGSSATPHAVSEIETAGPAADRGYPGGLSVHDSIFPITINPLPGEGMVELFTRARARLSEFEASLVHLQIFGDTNFAVAGSEAMQKGMGKIHWPVTWIEGASCGGHPMAGMQLFATTARAVERIELDGRVVGSVFADGPTRHCLLGNLGPGEKRLSRSGQTLQTMETLERALGLAGFSIADIVRTWFFLDDLLSWYAEFNKVRTQFYSGVKFRSGSTPASTGVSGGNPSKAALSLAAWAVQPDNNSTRVQEIASPLQCPAPTYGSSFSRAMEITTPKGRRVLISGTASIALEGQTLWKDDIHRQIALTMEVITEILQSRGLTLREVSRATAYFKRSADVKAFRKWCAVHDVAWLPVVATQCGICRDDLLFELEADAWTSTVVNHHTKSPI